MHRRIFQFATVLLWLALPLVAVQYREVWDQLPVHVATHFNAAGQANGWMSREDALHFGMGFVAFLLVIFTALLVHNSRSRVDYFSWALLGFCALILGCMVEVNHGIVSYNLTGKSMQLGGVLITIPIAAVVLIAIYIAGRREPALPSSHAASNDLLAEETHSGRAWTLLILPAIAGPVIAGMLVPAPAIRISMVLVGLIGLATIAAAWNGFQYRFLRARRGDSRARFPPALDPPATDSSYAIESWSVLRGYGIRGVGRTRAYVWCNKVVHIKTSNGDIYLGHNDPAQIVRDLDQMMQSHHRKPRDGGVRVGSLIWLVAKS